MKTFKIGALAKKTGLTVRALHHYDEIGLLSPSHRTQTGHRLYTEGDVQKLQEILLLQLMNFSLGQIKLCLEKKDFPFEEMAKAHLNRLHIEMQTQKVLYHRIESTIKALELQEALSIDNVIETIRAIAMYEKYYTPEQIETLKNREKALSKEEMVKLQADWENLFKEFKSAFNQGVDLNSPKVIEMGKKANVLIDAFTGKDPQMEKSLQKMYDAEGGHNVLSHHGVGISEKEFEYIKQAMRLAKT